MNKIGVVIFIILVYVNVMYYFDPYLFDVLPGSIDPEIETQLLSNSENDFYEQIEVQAMIQSDDFIPPSTEDVLQQLLWIPWP